MEAQPLFEHPACLITQLSAYVQEQLTERLAPLGIQPRHFGLLSLLAEQDGQNQHQLSEPLGVHRNVMVGLVDEMEERGLVARRRHPADRRAHAVHLLLAGRVLHAKAEVLVSDFEAKLGLDAASAETFTLLLKRVCEHAGLHHSAHPGLSADSTEPARDRAGLAVTGQPIRDPVSGPQRDDIDDVQACVSLARVKL
jgi:DNA-binding MarR family transcriptional regulator